MVHLEKRKVLVIEDEHSLRKDIVEMLTFEGYEVFEAEHGLAGVRQARQHHPDLIICDIMMPELNGYQVLEELRRDFQTQTIPFVFLTASTNKEDRRRGMDEGADDFLTKPFNVDDLLNTIRVRLEKHDEIIRRGRAEVSSAIILSMPHELRTPLTVILGFADIIMAETDHLTSNRTHEMANNINKAAMRLYHLVENYLIFAQIEIAENDTEFIESLQESLPFQPNALVELAAAEKAAIHKRTPDLKLEITADATVKIREDLMKKVIEELVDNAFKFSPPDSEVKVLLYNDEDSLYLVVIDHGRGMSNDQISRVGAHMQFDRKLYEQQGSGLGLVIALRIAELHQGTLTITSEQDVYTAVTVRLPRSYEA
ncbi:MAG: response regulator [Anaerolineae bacterium]|nr:response regulator [Anaerolineae bacterium]